MYLLRCCDGSLYTGWTIDSERRLARHRAGTASRYTASRLPVELAHAMPMPDTHRRAPRRRHASNGYRGRQARVAQRRSGARNDQRWGHPGGPMSGERAFLRQSHPTDRTRLVGTRGRGGVAHAAREAARRRRAIAAVRAAATVRCRIRAAAAATGCLPEPAQPPAATRAMSRGGRHNRSRRYPAVPCRRTPVAAGDWRRRRA